MKKILFIATVQSHIVNFHMPFIQMFLRQGYEVHVCTVIDKSDKGPKVEGLIWNNIDFSRSPYSIKILKALYQLIRYMKINDFSLIHVHTPIGAFLGRSAAKITGQESVIYTAHGFHFYRGAGWLSSEIYRTMESVAARWTDCIITMNKEDFEAAKKLKLRKINNVYQVRGVGVDLDKFTSQTKEIKARLRQQYGYKDSEFIMIYAAELNHNKNQFFLIDVVNILKDRIPNLKLLLAGSGILYDQYIERVNQLGLEKMVEILGYRKDIANLMMMADVAASASKREGLPVNIMEAMATGLPLVVTNCRGNRDLVEDGENGFVIEIGDKEEFANAIENLYQSEALREKFKNRNIELSKLYSLEKIMMEMEEIYRGFVNIAIDEGRVHGGGL